VFDHLGQEPWNWSPKDRALADTIAGYWVNFASSGDPNGAGRPAWPRFRAADGPILRLDEPAAVGAPPELATLSALDRTYSQVRGSPFGTPKAP
jgi:para-nitrobenzyl esterase